jgi:hypothetical protein
MKLSPVLQSTRERGNERRLGRQAGGDERSGLTPKLSGAGRRHSP